MCMLMKPFGVEHLLIPEPDAGDSRLLVLDSKNAGALPPILRATIGRPTDASSRAASGLGYRVHAF